MEDLGIVDALAQLSFLVQGRLAAHAAAEDVSMVSVRLLGVLRDRRPTMAELAALLGLDKSSTTGLVDRAERRGLVSRRPSPTDGRSTHVVLTRTGRALIGRVVPAFEADVLALTAGLRAAQRTQLSELATAVVAAAQAPARPQ